MLERQMSSLNYLYGYYKVSNIKLNIRLDIPSKCIEDPCVILSAAVGIYSEKLTGASCQDFSL